MAKGFGSSPRRSNVPSSGDEKEKERTGNLLSPRRKLFKCRAPVKAVLYKQQQEFKQGNY